MARIEATAEAVVVEGELLEEDCEKFEEALFSLRRSKVTWTTVDLSRVTAAAPGPINLLFAAWLDMFKQKRAPYLDAAEHIWRMLGKAAVDQRFLGKPAASVRIAQPG